MHPALLYLPGHRLAIAELSAARLDGHLVDLGEGFIPADLVEVAATRAAAIAPLIPQGTAASGPTAAWIHGAGDGPPLRHHVSPAVEHRIGTIRSRRLVVHGGPVPITDQVTLAGVASTSPVRTMLDLALWLHRDPTVLPWLASLARFDPNLVTDAITALDALQRVPGKIAGRAALLRVRTT